jgi:glucose/arabinose dehydrogenase
VFLQLKVAALSFLDFRVLLLAGILFGGNLPAQAKPNLAAINLPPGFAIEIWSDAVPNARSLALGDKDTVFVSTRRDGRVYGLAPQENGPPVVYTLAKNLRMPNGIAFHNGDLYVAENHRITRYRNIESNLRAVPDAETVVDDLPTERHHGWRFIAFGPDGKLYVSIGAPCNVCERDGFANIIRMNADGSDREVFARGIRNSVGLTWHPDNGELWFTDNGRDLMGDNTPPGELNHADRTGLHFGFPYCHGGDVPDPQFGGKRDCTEFVPPAIKLGPHVAPLGLLFYSGGMFPDAYKGQVLIAEHGSWNRSRKIGYRLSIVTIEDGKAIDYKPFVDGWLQAETASGRPVDLLQMKDGSVLVSDDLNGVLYRISYANPGTVGDAARQPDINGSPGLMPFLSSRVAYRHNWQRNAAAQ